MKPEIATLWTEKLRSGEYEQGKQTLHSKDDKFCCLGVLCDLAVNAGVIPSPALDENDRYLYDAEWYGILPERVRKWAGMKDTCGGYAKGTQLTIENDRGKTFAEIADIIDANVEVL